MKNKETVSRFTYSSIKTVWFYLNNIIFRHFLHEQLVLWVLRHCIFSLRFDLMWFLFFEIHDVCFNLDVFFFFLFYVVCQPTRHSLYRKFEVRAFHLACHSFVHTNILTTPTQPVALYPTGCARVLPPLILLARIYVCKSNQLTTTVYKTPRFQTFASPLGSLLPGGLATLCWNFSLCFYGQNARLSTIFSWVPGFYTDRISSHPLTTSSFHKTRCSNHVGPKFIVSFLPLSLTKFSQNLVYFHFWF